VGFAEFGYVKGAHPGLLQFAELVPANL